MSALAAVFQNLNPVLDRELRQRSRSARSIVMMSLLLTALAGVLYIAHLAMTDTNQFGDPLRAISTGTGAVMYEWVLFTELALLLLIIPGISASAVSGERDRQTLVTLQVTLMGRVSIFFGKVAASSAFVLLLLVASTPLLAVPFLVGGVGLGSNPDGLRGHAVHRCHLRDVGGRLLCGLPADADGDVADLCDGVRRGGRVDRRPRRPRRHPDRPG